MIRLSTSFRNASILACCFLLATACTKPKEDVIELVTGERPSCGRDDARLTATIDGGTWCADVLVRATAVDSALLVQGTALDGRSLAITLNSITTGTHTLTANGNGVLWMEGLVPYRIATAESGTLELVNDPTTGRLTGDLTVRLVAMTGNTERTLTAHFQVLPEGFPNGNGE